MLSVFKPVAEKSMAPLARALRQVPPNALSLLGLLFPAIFFVLVVNKQYAWALLAFIFNAVDLLDGMVARSTGKVTAFGGFLDSTIDRVADFVVIAAFGFAGIADWGIVLPLILLSYLISYMRSRIELAAKGKLQASVGIIERTERLSLLFAGLLLYALFQSVTILGFNLLELNCMILIFLSIITVGQRLAFAYRKL